MPRPRVSIAIPLYAARSFVDRITDNIRRLAAPDVEFVLSDQHGLDDALEQVQRRIDGAASLRCHSSRTGVGWIDNYNFLLREAAGDYVRILSQDDVLPAASLEAARAVLDADAATVLVVGPANLIDLGGDIVWRDTLHAPSPARAIGAATTLDAIHLFAGSRYHDASLGLMRRSTIAESGLSIPHTAADSGLSFKVLLFAIALRGRVRYVPEYLSFRGVHPASFTARTASATVAAEWRRTRSYWQAGLTGWRGALTSRASRIAGPPVLGAAIGQLIVRRLVERFGPRARAAQRVFRATPER